MIIDLSFSIISQGVKVKQGGQKLAALNFLTWLEREGYQPRIHRINDPKVMVEDQWNRQKEHGGLALGKYDIWMPIMIDPKWNQPKDTFFDCQLCFFSRGEQFKVRVNIIPPGYVKKRTDYDELVKRVCDFACGIHQVIDAAVTVVDRNRTQLGGSPYNFNTLPMHVGWYSIYNSVVSKKHGLQSHQNYLPNTLKLKQIKGDIHLSTTKPWSEYYRYGWNEDEYRSLLAFDAQPLFRLKLQSRR